MTPPAEAAAPAPGQAPVLDLAEIAAGDAWRVGPKVARLGQLARAGWRVPDGYAVTAGALSRWLPPAVRAEAERRLSSAEGHEQLAEVTRQVRELIEAQPLPGWLEDAVAGAHERLAGRTGHQAAALRVAVRSSSLAEDGARASFAGQYATYLGVTGISEVLRHVRRCWASGFSAHALEYRRRSAAAGPPAGSPLLHHELAVGVLGLVDARSAGVVFTMDPVSGDRGRLVVEANWGFGESVVSGQVTPDHWEVERDSGAIIAEHVGAKRAWACFDVATGSVVLRPLAGEACRRPSLAPQEVRLLCRQALEIEAAEGGVPQDVEWAIANGLAFPDSVFILQHRPETTWAATAATTRPASPAPAAEAAPEPEAAPGSFDPVTYALRNVFKVPGT